VELVGGVSRLRAFPPELGETPPNTDLILLVTPPDSRLVGGLQLLDALNQLQTALSARLGCRVQLVLDGRSDGSWPLFERRLQEASVPV
jgi:hypothetical protein